LVTPESVTDAPVGMVSVGCMTPPTKMPGAFATSRPLLTIPPVKADSVTDDAPASPVTMRPTKMPGSLTSVLLAEMVPMLTIPPANVSKVTAPAEASPPTKMPACPAAMMPALLMPPAKVPSVTDLTELL